METTRRTAGCPRCGTVARVKDRSCVELIDLPIYDRTSRLVWHKRRFSCTDPDCRMGTWTEEDATDRRSSPGAHLPGGPVGHSSGRTLRPECRRGGEGPRL